MFIRFLVVLLLVPVAGCSTYDVLAITADVALAVFTDEDKKPVDEQHHFWDPAVSKCIRVEKSKDGIERQLDAIERGKDYVILPTGEKYQVTRYPAEEMSGPTEKCLADHSD